MEILPPVAFEVDAEGRVHFADSALVSDWVRAAYITKPKEEPVPNTNCGGCNTVSGCGPVNQVKGCGSKIRA
jgi:hypothetical protein